MNRRIAVAFTLLLALSAACAGCDQTAAELPLAPQASKLVGQVLLPEGVGSRGVEIVLTLAPEADQPSQLWVLFDAEGHFEQPLDRRLLSLSVQSGIGSELHRVDAEQLAQSRKAAAIDVGLIDLRSRLVTHDLLLRAAAGAPAGTVRIGMWSGPPPPDVALGSRQFPPVVLGSSVQWLLPPDAHSIYFLVEHGSGGDRDWRSGPQRLFGPFSMASLPVELLVD